MAAQLVTRLRHFAHRLPAKALGSGAGASSGLARPVPPQAATLLRALSTHTQESFMSGSNSVYVEEMYRAWLKNKESVHKSWDVYFTAIESGQTEVCSSKQQNAQARRPHSLFTHLLLRNLVHLPHCSAHSLPLPSPSLHPLSPNRVPSSPPRASKPPSPPPPPPWPPALCSTRTP